MEMKCKVDKLCGGCQLLHVPYAEQASLKRQKVVDLVRDSGLRLQVQEPHMALQSIAYRNKVIVGFGRDPNTKKIYSGLYAPHSHRVINTKGCRMHPSLVNQIIDEITSLTDSMKLQVYNPKTGTGLLRHVLIRYAKETDQVMVVFVTSRPEFPSRRNMVNALVQKFPQIKTILQNVNPRDTSVVLQNDTQVLYGKGTITDILCGLKITFTPSSFYQIHHDQCQELYTLARSLLDLKPDQTVLDTYCGVGTIGLVLAQDCRQVTGVEVNKEAVENAWFNARQNDISNIRFVAMDSTQFMKEARKVHMHYDAIVLDPPRAGTTHIFIESACALHPSKILYISCDPRTQIRDLKLFKRYGYTGRTIELVDMFPNTDALESLVLLEPDARLMKRRSLHPEKESSFGEKRVPRHAGPSRSARHPSSGKRAASAGVRRPKGTGKKPGRSR